MMNEQSLVVIREMRDEDVPSVAQIEEKTFSMPWSEADFRDMIKQDNMTYVLAEIEGKIIGGAGLRNILGDAEITNVAVLNEYRNTGIGYKILTALIEKGKKIGAEAFTLEVRISNKPAIHLYEKLGFLSEGVRKNFYEKPKEDALIMWKR